MKRLIGFFLCLALAVSLVAVPPGIMLMGKSKTYTPPSAGGGTDPGTPLNWYKCNLGSTTVLADDGSAPQTGTLVNAAMWATTASFLSINGNGTSYGAYTSTSYGPGSNKVSVSMWIYSTSWTATGSNQILFETSPVYFSTPGSLVIAVDGTNSHLIGGMSGSTSGTYTVDCPALSTSTWIHITLVYDMTGPSITVYYGTSAQSTTPTNSAFTGSTSFTNQHLYMLSRSSDSSPSLFSNAGEDDIRVFNVSLSASNVTYLDANRQ